MRRLTLALAISLLPLRTAAQSLLSNIFILRLRATCDAANLKLEVLPRGGSMIVAPDQKTGEVEPLQAIHRKQRLLAVVYDMSWGADGATDKTRKPISARPGLLTLAEQMHRNAIGAVASIHAQKTIASSRQICLSGVRIAADA